MGTGNNLHILTDTTGNRRWLPFEVLRIDNPYEYAPPYEGLYAQVYCLLQTDTPTGSLWTRSIP